MSKHTYNPRLVVTVSDTASESYLDRLEATFGPIQWTSDDGAGRMFLTFNPGRGVRMRKAEMAAYLEKAREMCRKARWAEIN